VILWSFTHIITWLMIRSSQEKDNRTGKNDQETIQIISEQSAAKMRREDTRERNDMKAIRWNRFRLVENRFDAREVESSKLNAIVAAGYQTVRKMDVKAHRILVIQDAQEVERVSGALDTAIYSPALMIIGYDAVYAWRRRDMRYYLDYGVAESDAMQIKNNVIAEGRGAGLLMTPIEISDSEAVRRVLDLPESFHIAAILEVGYPLQEKDDRIGTYAVAG